MRVILKKGMVSSMVRYDPGDSFEIGSDFVRGGNTILISSRQQSRGSQDGGGWMLYTMIDRF